MATWKRRYSTVPIAKWQQKANLIGKETNWLRAAAAHNDLNRPGATANRPGAEQVSCRIGPVPSDESVSPVPGSGDHSTAVSWVEFECPAHSSRFCRLREKICLRIIFATKDLSTFPLDGKR